MKIFHFLVPGSEERKLNKVLTSNSDCIVLDIEDGIAFGSKPQARTLISKMLSTPPPSSFSSEFAVRINSIGSGFEVDDLMAILPCPNLDAILIPKVDYPHHVHFVSRFIDMYALPERFFLLFPLFLLFSCSFSF